MDKKGIVSELIGWGISLILAFWLIDGSIWLKLFLAGSMSSTISLTRKLNHNRQLFDIADNELIRVSALANDLKREVDELNLRLENISLKE